MVEDNQFTLIRCENSLEFDKIYKWKISILNSKLKLILVGITQDEENLNLSLENINGWYLYCFNSTLYSGKPHNYKNKKTNLTEINKDTFKEYVEFIQDIKARHLNDREACPINYGTLCDILTKGYKMLGNK